MITKEYEEYDGANGRTVEQAVTLPDTNEKTETTRWCEHLISLIFNCVVVCRQLLFSLLSHTVHNRANKTGLQKMY